MQEYEWLEYFAGLGNLTKCMKSAMYKSARFDLLDNLHPEHYKSNFMDLNSASGFAPLAHNFNWTLVGFSIALKLSTVDRFVLRRGFWFQRLDSWLLPRHPCQRLAILCMLRTVAADFCAHFGLKCSSFCRVNVGTSYRSACTAIGLHFYKSVASSNKLLERIGVNLTCLGTCMGMINKNHFTSWMRFFASANQQPVQDMPFGIALHSTGGCWTLEQPNGSYQSYYPAWRYIVESIFNTGGPMAVRASAFNSPFCFFSSIIPRILHSRMFMFRFLVFGHYIPRPGPRGAVVDGFVRGWHPETPCVL